MAYDDSADLASWGTNPVSTPSDAEAKLAEALEQIFASGDMTSPSRRRSAELGVPRPSVPPARGVSSARGELRLINASLDDAYTANDPTPHADSWPPHRVVTVRRALVAP